MGASEMAACLEKGSGSFSSMYLCGFFFRAFSSLSLSRFASLQLQLSFAIYLAYFTVSPCCYCLLFVLVWFIHARIEKKTSYNSSNNNNGPRSSIYFLSTFFALVLSLGVCFGQITIYYALCIGIHLNLRFDHFFTLFQRCFVVFFVFGYLLFRPLASLLRF